jgi:hypothetical protein
MLVHQLAGRVRLEGETLNSFTLRLGKAKMSAVITCTQDYSGASDYHNEARNETGKSTLAFSTDDVAACTGNPNESTDQLLELIRAFSKSVGIYDSIKILTYLETTSFYKTSF